MAKIVSFTCPHCGAALSVDADDRDVTCRFCQVTSVVQRAPAPAPRPPWPPGPMPVVHVSVEQVRAHVRKEQQGISVLWLAIPAAILVAVVLGFAWRSKSTSKGPSSVLGEYPATAPPVTRGAPRKEREFGRWGEGRSFPLLVDASGDGKKDVLVLEGRKELRAFDGASGEAIWDVPVPDGAPLAKVFAAGSTIVVASDVQAHLYDVKTGEKRATATLDDKVELACASTGAEVRLGLEDGSVVALDARSGAAKALPKSERCGVLGTIDAPADDLGNRVFAVSYLDPALRPIKCGGVRVSGTYNYVRADPCGPTLRLDSPELAPAALIPFEGGHLALGARAKGRRAAVVGLVKGGKLAWSATLSKAEPAALPEAPIDAAALDGTRLAVSYMETSGPRVSVRDARTGAVVTDVALPRSPLSISALGGGAFVVLTKAHVLVLGADGKLTTLVE